MKSARILIVVLVSIGSVFSVTTAWAAFSWHPRLTLEEEYNDNIYLSSDNEEQDWITTVSPGISLTYDNRSLEATVDYSLRYRFYLNNDQENIDSFDEVQRANASALFFPERPFTLRLTETISSETLDQRYNYAAYNELVNSSTVYHSTITPEYTLRFSPTFSLVLGYVYDRFDYVAPAGIDSEEHLGRVSLMKTLTPTTDVFVRYAYRVHKANVSIEEFDREDYTLGITQRLTSRTTASVEGGYSTVEYDSGLDTNLTTLLANMTYQLSEAINFVLLYSQDFTVTATEGLTERREASFAANYQRESLTAAAQLYWNNADYVLQSREDEALGVRFNLSKPLARAVTSRFDAEYENAQYDDLISNENVNRYILGASLDYTYRRFLATLGYRHLMNDSDININDYTNNIVTLTGTVRF